MISRFIKLGMAMLAVSFVISHSAFAIEVPEQDSKAQFFYVYGPQGLPVNGKKEDPSLTVYIDVPDTVKQDFSLSVYDPDTYGDWDDIGGYAPYENTETEYKISGNKDIVSKVFKGNEGYNNKWFDFAPITLDQGQKIGSKTRFTVKITALRGDDQNLFKLKISPDNAEVFSNEVSFRLLPSKGGKIYFHPWVQEGQNTLIIHNFDLDSDGGESHLYDPYTKKSYRVKDSVSGQWAETTVKFQEGPTRRLQYIVKTLNQERGNAALKITDANGNYLPLYFQKVDAPALPPVAPKVTNACNRFKFDATKSYDINNDKISYHWDFGDGTESIQPVEIHDFANAGTYKVVLTVSDNSGLVCNTSVTTQEVRANLPPQAAFAGPEMTCAGSSVTFDASATKDDMPANLTYLWSFGDGTTAEGKTVTKKFDKGGVYDVVLTVDDNAGSKCSRDSVKQMIRVNTPPVANAGDDQLIHISSAAGDYVVNFDGSKSFDPDNNSLKYMWQFGDGTNAEGAKVSHVYANPGDYTAKLVVNDQSGTPCDMSVDTVKVNLNKAPVANAGQDQYACVGAELTFDASASSTEGGENLKYAWSFGDGETAEGQVVKHRFTKTGAHKVTLTVDDNKGTAVSQSVDVVNVFLNSNPSVQIANVDKACTNDKVAFQANASDPDGDKLKYIWNFGDGAVVEGGSNMSHQYQKGGNYKVSVTVDDGKSSPCSKAVASSMVKVNTAPIASTGPNLVCCVDQVTQFDGSGSNDADGDKLTYLWNFGDGKAIEGNTPQVTHTFKESGAYQIVVTVDDNQGTKCSSSSAGFAANVNAKPTAVMQVETV